METLAAIGLAFGGAAIILGAAYVIAKLLIGPSVAREQNLMRQNEETRQLFETRLRAVEAKAAEQAEQLAKANARIAELKNELDRERDEKARLAGQYEALRQLVADLQGRGHAPDHAPIDEQDERRFRDWLAEHMGEGDLEILSANARMGSPPSGEDLPGKVLWLAQNARRTNRLRRLMDEAVKMRPGVPLW